MWEEENYSYREARDEKQIYHNEDMKLSKSANP